MLQKLLGGVLISLNTLACTTQPPRPTVCVQNTNTQQAHCYDPKTDTVFRKPYLETNKWIMTSREDYLEILNFIDKLLIETGVKIHNLELPTKQLPGVE